MPCNGLLRADVLQHPEYLNLELFDFVAGDYRLADAVLARAHVAQRENGQLRETNGGRNQGEPETEFH
ncbi:MAG: hypothetical protein ABSB67_20320 [Bryobacteraceae bacterium]